MIRHLLIFVIAAGVGAILALALRSMSHRPYAEPGTPGHERHQPATPSTTKIADPHADHTVAPGGKPVNTICAICGMKPDPTITATYRGHLIAFGCQGCPGKFTKDPDRYGPYFLRSEEAP